MEKCRKCYDCNNVFPVTHFYWISDLGGIGHCKWCGNERRHRNTAICYILNNYNLRAGQYPEELLEIETSRAKIRFIIRDGRTEFIKHKTPIMITRVTNSTEMREALNENLHALITKKRKLLVVKEVNNTLGKILMDVKMELMQNALTGSRETVSWFDQEHSGVRVKNIKMKAQNELRHQSSN